jgi:uncharacterized membrane protein
MLEVTIFFAFLFGGIGCLLAGFLGVAIEETLTPSATMFG